MELDTYTINLVKNILCFPQRYGLKYFPLWEFFSITNVVTPQDKLYEQYIGYVKVAWPKVIFSIILSMMYKHYSGIDKRSGKFGYRLYFINPEPSDSDTFLRWHNEKTLEFNHINDLYRADSIDTKLLETSSTLSTSIVTENISASNSDSNRVDRKAKDKYARRFSIEVNQPIMKEFLLEPHPATIIGDPVLASNRHSRRAEAAQKRKNKMK